MEIIAKDKDSQSPDDLIDVIFACSSHEVKGDNFSKPQTFTGALRIAEIVLSFRVRCHDNDNCSSAHSLSNFVISRGT